MRRTPPAASDATRVPPTQPGQRDRHEPTVVDWVLTAGVLVGLALICGVLAYAAGLL